VTDADFATRLRHLYENDAGDLPSNVPELADLAPAGTGQPVLLRVDLDIAVKDGKVTDLTRVDAVIPTITELQDRGYRPVLFGHVGRDPSRTARPIGEAFAERLSRELTFVDDWLDPETWVALDDLRATVASSTPDQLVVLENTRKYSVEQALWKQPPTAELSAKLERSARSIVSAVSEIFVNDGIAANNFDFSTCVLPLAARQRYLGRFYGGELRWIQRAQAADAIIISGLKANKLDDLERIITHGRPSLVIVGGSLASSLYKARLELAGVPAGIGLAESDPENPAYVSPERRNQARHIVEMCGERNIDLTLPTDFVLDDGKISDEIPPGRAQLDAGPRTRSLFSKALHEYSRRCGSSGKVFYNGVLGVFEDDRFRAGTVQMVQDLNALSDEGVEVYVGGGEGRLAMERFGDLKRVAHAFTAGGTILKAVAHRPIGPLFALVS
jgi:phosphoglycerate kinase